MQRASRIEIEVDRNVKQLQTDVARVCIDLVRE
jgi:hypothetical protein